MVNQFKCILPNFINIAQSAFVVRKMIGDNILLCQELFQGYNKDSQNFTRYTIKIDLVKTFDTTLACQCGVEFLRVVGVLIPNKGRITMWTLYLVIEMTCLSRISFVSLF